jgi:hypothetical protein
MLYIKGTLKYLQNILNSNLNMNCWPPIHVWNTVFIYILWTLQMRHLAADTQVYVLSVLRWTALDLSLWRQMCYIHICMDCMTKSILAIQILSYNHNNKCGYFITPTKYDLTLLFLHSLFGRWRCTVQALVKWVTVLLCFSEDNKDVWLSICRTTCDFWIKHKFEFDPSLTPLGVVLHTIIVQQMIIII